MSAGEIALQYLVAPAAAAAIAWLVSERSRLEKRVRELELAMVKLTEQVRQALELIKQHDRDRDE